jgi:anti-sigma B factor antagonist
VANLKVEIEQQPHAVVAHLIGEAGMDEADDLDRSLRLLTAAKPALAVLDLAGMSYIASMGIGALVRFRNDISHAGGHVVFAALRPLVLDTFKHAGLLRVFQVFPTVEDAIRLGSVPAQAPASTTPSNRISK